jgi:hypothetical protein
MRATLHPWSLKLGARLLNSKRAIASASAPIGLPLQAAGGFNSNPAPVLEPDAICRPTGIPNVTVHVGCDDRLNEFPIYQLRRIMR